MTPKQFILLPHRWEWSYCDCHVFAANWVQIKTGIDPAAEWRGRYDSSAGAEILLNAYGGAEALTGMALEREGFRRTEEPQDGDIGIVTADTESSNGTVNRRTFPAIKCGPLWGVMSLRGPQMRALERSGVAWKIV